MTPELETHSEHHKTGHRWVDISVAVCALIVSVTSLCVAVVHGHTMERMADANARLVAANSWPFLQGFTSNLGRNGEHVVSLNVVNSGVGPARIETVEAFWKERPIRSIAELLARCCQAGRSPLAAAQAAEPGAGGAAPTPLLDSLETSSLRGTVLRAAETRRLALVPLTEQTDTLTKTFETALNDVEMRVCYCSVFDECWITDLHQLHPREVQQCPAPKVTFE